MREDVSKGRKGISLEAKGAILGMAAAAATLGVTFGMSSLMHGGTGRSIPQVHPDVSVTLPAVAGAGELPTQLVRGRVLFSQECAACHGSRAQGGFGLDLRHLEMSDAQIAATISAGMKPGMPAFGRKYGGSDVRALTQYVRSLNK